MPDLFSKGLLAGKVVVPMSALDTARDDFYAGRRTSASAFVVNDAVEIVAGDSIGHKGAVISLERVDPSTYLIERGDGGGDLLVEGYHLRRLDDDEKGQ